MEKIMEFVHLRMKQLNKNLIATPDSIEHLESFAKANNGSMDMLLMQMAIQYGYKMAMEDITEIAVLQSEHE